MATLNPAKAVKIDAYQGSIEPGKYADLLLVSKKGAGARHFVNVY